MNKVFNAAGDPNSPLADNLKCGCGKGYASEYDNLCRYCRESLVRRALAKKVGVRFRGDGMTVAQFIKAKGYSLDPHAREVNAMNRDLASSNVEDELDLSSMKAS